MSVTCLRAGILLVSFHGCGDSLIRRLNAVIGLVVRRGWRGGESLLHGP